MKNASASWIIYRSLAPTRFWKTSHRIISSTSKVLLRLDVDGSDENRYLLIPYYLADLTLKITAGDRKNNLKQAQTHFEDYLRSLESYSALSSEDFKLYEKYLESPGSFSTAGTNDPGARRARKIARFKEKKELKQKLEVVAITVPEFVAISETF